jgi:hypothetical protein
VFEREQTQLRPNTDNFGVENITTAYGKSGQFVGDNFTAPVARGLGGQWYSTTEEGACASTKASTKASKCHWRVAEEGDLKNATCVLNALEDAVRITMDHWCHHDPLLQSFGD